MSLKNLALVTATAATMAGCSGAGDEGPAGPKEWTILVFMNADNNLENAALNNVNQLEAVGSSDGVNLVVQIDRSTAYDRRDGDWTGARRLFIQADDDPEAIGSDVVADLGEVAMNDAAALQDFLAWGMREYPADRYGVLVWDHGGGFKVLSVDDSEDGRAATPSEFTAAMRGALDGAGRDRFDLLAFDMCLMGMIEVDLELADVARVRVASEELMPGKGLDYVTSFGALVDHPDMDARAFAARLVDDFRAHHEALGDSGDTTLAAVDLGRIGEVTGALGAFVDVSSARMATLWPSLGRAMSFAEAYGEPPSVSGLGTGFIDLGHVVSITGELSGDPEVHASAEAVLGAIDGAVIARTNGKDRPHARGFSVFNVIPRVVADAKGDLEARAEWEAWSATRFAGEGRWEELLAAMLDAYSGTTIVSPTVSALSSSSVKQITDGAIEDGDGIVIEGWIDGKGLAGATVEVYQDFEDQRVLVSQRRVAVPTRTLPDGTVVPDLGEDQSTFTAEWFPIATVLDVGQGALANPVVLPGADGGTLAVAVQYDVAGSGKSFEGQMLFRPSYAPLPEFGGELLKLFLYQDTPKGKLVAAYTPAPGDSIRTRAMFYGLPPDFTASWDGREYLFDPPEPTVIGEAPLALVSVPFLPGTVLMTIRATDVVGLYGLSDFEPITITP